jgi:hypothetical protein
VHASHSTDIGQKTIGRNDLRPNEKRTRLMSSPETRKRFLYAFGALIVLAVIFQLFLRYQYVHTVGYSITRIDRLTGASCELPCAPAISNQSTPNPWDAVGRPTPTGAVDALIQKARSSPPADPYQFKKP